MSTLIRRRELGQLPQTGPVLSDFTLKCMITYKLLRLEEAQSSLDQHLRSFINKAKEDVQSILNSPVSTNQCNELLKALEAKCQAVDKVLSLLYSIQNDLVNASAETGVLPNQLQPLGDKGALMLDVLKFWPVLQNVLMPSSLAKAHNVLGPTLAPQHLKQFLVTWPKASQSDLSFCSISLSDRIVVVPNSLSNQSKAKEKEQAVPICEERSQSDAVVKLPAIIQSQNDIIKRQPLIPPTTKIITLENTVSNPMKIAIDAPLPAWGFENDVEVKHQKQTSSQLLDFLRICGKTKGALEATFTECKTNFDNTSSVTQLTFPTKSTNKKNREDAADENNSIHVQALKQRLIAEMENQAPVFRVKQVKSCGSLTYTFMMATQTELWDIGEITEERYGSSEASILEKEMGIEDRSETPPVASTETLSLGTQSLPNMESQNNSAVAARVPEISNVRIPDFQIRKFDEMEVVVSHIVSPGNFYIQHADTTMKQQALVSDRWEARSSFAEQNCIPDIGTLVMGWFLRQKQWCRAQVTKICYMSGGNGTTDSSGNVTDVEVEVKRLDYGDSACLSLWKIKGLTPEITVLPLQAVQVSLANVTPVNGKDWSKEAVDWFRTMVADRTLYSRVFPQGLNLTVELFLEKGNMSATRRGAGLSFRLAQNGHANYSRLKNVGRIKSSTARDQMKEQESAREKRLISCYLQSRK